MLVIEHNRVGTIKRTDLAATKPPRGEPKELCETCELSEAPKQISELEPRDGHTEPKDAEQAGLSTPETTPAPEINVIDTTPTEAEHAGRARSTLEAERPRGWIAVSADLRTNHIIDDKRPRKPPDRRAVYLSHLDGGLVEDNY